MLDQQISKYLFLFFPPKGTLGFAPLEEDISRPCWYLHLGESTKEQCPSSGVPNTWLPWPTLSRPHLPTGAAQLPPALPGLPKGPETGKTSPLPQLLREEDEWKSFLGNLEFTSFDPCHTPLFRGYDLAVSKSSKFGTGSRRPPEDVAPCPPEAPPGVLLPVPRCALPIPLGVSGPRGWSVWHSRTAFPARLGGTLDYKEHRPPQEGLKSAHARERLPGAHPKSATYSARVNLITIKREERLLQRGKESTQRMVWRGPPVRAGRWSAEVEELCPTELDRLAYQC